MKDSLENIFQIGEALEERLGQLEDNLEEQINKVVDISRIGSVFTSYLNMDVVLPMVIETGLRIVKGEVGEVTIFSLEGEPKSVSWGLSSKMVKQIKADGDENVIEYIRRTGESLVKNDLDFQTEVPGGGSVVTINSLIISPLKAQDKVVGVISIANKEDHDDFSDEDKFSLEMLGSFAAVAVRNAELHREALANQKIEHELQIAENVQKTLMPKKKICHEELEVNTYHDQAGQVGGDFYDIIQIARGKYLIVVADVSNKGIPAALIMTSARSYVRAGAENMTSLAELVTKVNKHLCRDIEPLGSMFVTMFFGLIDVNQHKLCSVNAGHPPGFLLHGDNVAELKTGGSFIGQFDDMEFIEDEIDIFPGDKLIVYTDGIFECVNAQGEMLGLSKTKDFVIKNRNADWSEFSEKLQTLLEEYSYDEGWVDDTTLLTVEIIK
ncbi:MAG: SpoIIE family protein phosphatase [candidate division Zixibacteria bacterium]|nr:SpoIIE family protein phosphatase [candidate division Zixibacteria bacterium]